MLTERFEFWMQVRTQQQQSPPPQIAALSAVCFNVLFTNLSYCRHRQRRRLLSPISLALVVRQFLTHNMCIGRIMDAMSECERWASASCQREKGLICVVLVWCDITVVVVRVDNAAFFGLVRWRRRRRRDVDNNNAWLETKTKTQFKVSCRTSITIHTHHLTIHRIRARSEPHTA